MGELYLGVDGGGSHTVAAVADRQGKLLGLAQAGPCHLTTLGASAAGRELKTAVDGALAKAGAEMADVSAACVGLPGLAAVNGRNEADAWLQSVLQGPRAYVENQALLALRAATKEAVGVGLVCDVFTDCVARDRYGRRHQIGGMGTVSGDVGNAEDLARRALGAAWMAFDGRTGPSSLTGAVCRAVGVKNMTEVADRLVRGEVPEPMLRALVDALFESARGGDGLATRLLEDTGRRLGAAVVAAMRALVLRGGNAIAVVGGTMLQPKEHDILFGSAARRIRQSVSEAHVVLLETDPVVGAVLFARDLEGQAPRDFALTVRQSELRS